MYKNVFYNTYKKNVYSQNGEDGIIEEILKRLNITSGWVCEFGAWDGKHLSNTFHLVKNRGFNAVYIEGDSIKFKDLLVNANQCKNIKPINAFVEYNSKKNNLDSILSTTEIPKDFDVLSIDIDSFDYQIWKSLQLYLPKIVIIEINSYIHPDVKDHIHTPNKFQGTSFKPMLELGIQKGYKFLLHTGNMFFIRNDLFDQLNTNYENPLENFNITFFNEKQKYLHRFKR